MPQDPNIEELLATVYAKADYDRRNRKAFKERSGKLSKFERQGATAGAIGQGLGTLAKAYGMFGGGANAESSVAPAGSSTGYDPALSYPGDAPVPGRFDLTRFRP